jgi:lipopolysaccharide transport system permease protein
VSISQPIDRNGGPKRNGRGGKPRTFAGGRNFENYRDILIVLLQKELKVRYNNKLLGYLWSIANPLASAFVYFIAFKILMRIQVEDYPLVLISGIFPWQWMSNAIGSSPNVFVGNSSIIKKVNFPRNIVPLCMVSNHMIHFLASIPVIILFLAIYGQAPSPTWLIGMPLLMVAHFAMAYGIALTLASINLFFRDLERLTGIVLNFTFYLTPILYPVDLIPERVRHLIVLNPFAPLVIAWREMFLFGTLNFPYILVSFGYGVLFMAIGTLVYRRLSWKFAEVL